MYLTPTELREKLGLDADALPDAAANSTIEDACDWIDSQLGNREVDPTTGRKVVEGEVQPWQWTKLKRATLKVAVLLHSQPSMLTEQQWDTIKGPDFETSGPRTTGAEMFGSDVSTILDQSGLRVLTAVFGVGRDRPPWYGFSFNDPDEP